MRRWASMWNWCRSRTRKSRPQTPRTRPRRPRKARRNSAARAQQLRLWNRTYRIRSVPDYFLTTERLGFRSWQADDLPLATTIWGDDRFSHLLGGPFSAEQIRARLDRE